jgi:hypothetical protein
VGANPLSTTPACDQSSISGSIQALKGPGATRAHKETRRRGDYRFRKCIASVGASREQRAVVQARKRGVCPACEETTSEEKVEALQRSPLNAARYRASHPTSL